MTSQAAPSLPEAHARSRGWQAMRGFGNVFRKEMSAWTGTRSWWLQPLIWLAILIGSLLLPLYLMREVFVSQAESVLALGLEMFFSLGALVPAIGAVLLMHGSVIGERQLGTAAWVLSKPVGRTAFLTAKLVANAAALLVAALVVPGIVAYGLLSLENGEPLPVGHFAGALGLDAIAVLFYLTLSLALSAALDNRSVVLAVSLGLLLGGDLVIGLAPGLAQVTPWVLGRFAAVVGQGMALPSAWPVLSTLVWCGVLMTFALWRFGREDL